MRRRALSRRSAADSRRGGRGTDHPVVMATASASCPSPGTSVRRRRNNRPASPRYPAAGKDYELRRAAAFGSTPTSSSRRRGGTRLRRAVGRKAVSGLLTCGRLPPGWSSRDLALASRRSGARGRATCSPRADGERAGALHWPAAADTATGSRSLGLLPAASKWLT